MNYLAHFSLAAGDEGLLVGALLGDSVKGYLKGEYPQHWERGIALHRAIDAFADSHPANLAAKTLFPQHYDRFVAIILDVFFDYCLVNQWRQFYPHAHSDFVDEVYHLLVATDWPSIRSQQQATNIYHYDMLSRCGDWDMLEQTLVFIGQRLRYDNPLAEALPVLQQQEQALTAVFLQFYPELQAYVTQWRDKESH